jgi:hypothetical protein
LGRRGVVWNREGTRVIQRKGKGREQGREEGKGREGKGREGKGREGKGREGKEGKGREGKGREGRGGRKEEEDDLAPPPKKIPGSATGYRPSRKFSAVDPYKIDPDFATSGPTCMGMNPVQEETTKKLNLKSFGAMHLFS